MEQVTGLSQARAHADEFDARLAHLKQALSAPRLEAERPQRWKALRRALEAAREALGGWTPRRPEPGVEDPALWRRANELEARGLKAESALAALEEAQRALDERRGSVLAELERLHDGWRLLNGRLQDEPSGAAGSANVPELFERWYGLLSLVSRALEEERAVRAEAAEAERVWRWLVDSAFPLLERGLREADDTLTLPTLRRLLEEQDLRWTAARRRWADEGAASAGREAEKQLAAIDRLIPQVISARGEAGEAKTRLAELEGQLLRLREELASAKAASQEAAAAVSTWKDLCEAARGDLDRLMERLGAEEQRAAAAEALAASLQGRAAQAEAAAAAEKDRAAAAEARSEEALKRARMAEDRAALAESRAPEAEKRAAQAQVQAMKAEVRIAVAEAWAMEAEARAEDSEARVLRAEGGAAAARARAAESETRAAEALRRAAEVEPRAKAAEARAAGAERRVAEAQARAGQQEYRAVRAEARAAEAEQKVKETDARAAAIAQELRKAQLELKKAQAAAPGTGAAASRDDRPEANGAPAMEAPPTEMIPSVEPVLEPAWQTVLDRLRQPLASAAAQLRRLNAARMPPDFKAAVRLAAGAVAQASDTMRVVKEFLDEGGGAEEVSGRAEAALDAALTTWGPVLARRGVRVKREVERKLPAVSASTESLRVAFYQILRNAFEAMPRGGSLQVSVSWDEARQELRATIADSGPGFPEGRRLRLFQPFESDKAGHLGVGLALAQRVARRAGGELEAAVGAEGGAVLTMRLPPAADRRDAGRP